MIPRTVATQPLTASRPRVETSLSPPYTGRRAGVFVAYPKGIRVGEAGPRGRRAIDRGGASEKVVLARGGLPCGGAARRLRGATGVIAGRFVGGRRIQRTLQPQRPAALRGWRPDRRHRQARLPAVVRGVTPKNYSGYEGEVANEIAERMDLPIKWVVEPFNKSYAPGAKDYDFDINQITITPERERGRRLLGRVLRQHPGRAGPEGLPVADATTLQDLKDVQLGAQVGTTSLDFINETSSRERGAEDLRLRPTTSSRALESGQIDVFVTDLVTTVYLRDFEIDNSEVVGQYPRNEQFGMLFEKGNPLVGCVNQVLGRDEERRDAARTSRMSTCSSTWASQPSRTRVTHEGDRPRRLARTTVRALPRTGARGSWAVAPCSSPRASTVALLRGHRGPRRARRRGASSSRERFFGPFHLMAVVRRDARASLPSPGRFC